jgi:hypothetical protein
MNQPECLFHNWLARGLYEFQNLRHLDITFCLSRPRWGETARSIFDEFLATIISYDLQFACDDTLRVINGQIEEKCLENILPPDEIYGDMVDDAEIIRMEGLLREAIQFGCSPGKRDSVP